jgi:hypothetical protein
MNYKLIGIWFFYDFNFEITISLNGVKTKIPKTNAAVGIWNF